MIRVLLRGLVQAWGNAYLIFILLVLGGACSSVHAGLPKFNTYYPSNSVYIGRVYGRSIVMDEAKNLPKWATYNKEGGHTELSDIDLERASKGRVVSATILNNYYSQLVDFRARYNDDIELIPAEGYKARQSTPGGFQTQDGTPISGLPELNEGQFVIALPGKSNRFNFNGSRIETITFPFDVIKESKILSDTFTVLIDENGEFIKQSPERIGYLSAFVLGEDGKVAPSTEYDQYTGAMTNLFQRKVLNPVGDVRITGENGMAMNQEAKTDLGGAYRLQMRFGCPGGAFQTITYLDAHMSYGMFNPRGLSSMPYWISFPAIDNCLGFIDPNTGISTANNEVTIVNFQVAISVITGTAILWNADISDTNPTEYHAEQSPKELVTIINDYDGDNLIDATMSGKITEAGLFEASADSDIYGVFLSGSPREDGQPNFTRVMDVKANTTAQGLVSIINKNDMRNTDIYAFRESTGELLTERIGIPKEEEALMVIGGHSEGLSESSQFTYTFAIRSPEDMLSMHSKRHDGWEAWQADNKINPALHSRQSDFIRTGEQVRIVAINRATGYMGSRMVTMGNTGDGGDLTNYVNTLILGPPNLKVWATRRYQPQGILKSSEKERNTISNEGAATTDDYVIEVHTQWLDHNNQPLPDELQGRGFTGRLVKVVSDAGAFETKVTEFPINPGRHMQVVKFNEGAVGKGHFYFQVNGKIEAAENDFSSGTHNGVLVHRPSLYVPIKVPLYNEQETKINSILEKQSEAASDTNKYKEEPLFDWVYRPELSFSVVDLEVQAIYDEKNLEDNVRVNYIEDGTPVMLAQDDLIEILFNLSSSEFDRITPLDGEQEFILAVGDREVSITIDKGAPTGQTVLFENLDFLNEIEVEDYQTMSFYLNQDAQNILWKFGFRSEGLILTSSSDEGSNEEGSFIICPLGTPSSICEKQDPIKVQLVADLKKGDTITWKVEALKGNTAESDYDAGTILERERAYGKTKLWKIGRYEANIVAVGINDNEGRYREVWELEPLEAINTAFFSFEPNLKEDENHLPVAYSKSGTSEYSCTPQNGLKSQYDTDCVNGTNMTNVYRHNPHVGYKITATLNDGYTDYPFVVEAKMDEVDVLRQEYLNHQVSSGSIIKVPSREKLVPVPAPSNKWVEKIGQWSDYPYNLVVNDGMVDIAEAVIETFNLYKDDEFTLSNNQTVTLPTGAVLEVNSGFRNPERQERVGSAINSSHLRGAAVDFGFSGISTLDDKEIANYILWKIFTEHPLASGLVKRFALEKGISQDIRVYNTGNNTDVGGPYWDSGDEDEDGIADIYGSAGHFHLQKY